MLKIVDGAREAYSCGGCEDFRRKTVPVEDLHTVNLGSATRKSSRRTITDRPALESLWPNSAPLRAIFFRGLSFFEPVLSSEMIISDFELSKAREKLFTIPKSRAIDLGQEPAAHVRVLVSLIGNARAAASSEINVLLYVKNLAHDDAVAAAAVLERLPFSVDDSLPDYTEVHRARLNPPPQDTQLQYALDATEDYELRVEFYDRHFEEGDSDAICYADFTLGEILAAPRERFDAPVLDLETKLPVEGTVRLSVVWMREWAARLVFEVKIKINKRLGWPFSTTRPFFVVFVRNFQTDVWDPVYRSEVLTQPSDLPDAHGSMYFEHAVLNTQAMYDATQGMELSDNHPLRIEVFHYKTQGSSKMLAYMCTTNLELRQESLNEKMKMEVNTFPEGELVGSVVLKKRTITATLSFFSFLMEFGGDVAGYCLYLNVSLQSVKEGRFSSFSSRALTRPFYYLKRNENEAWPSVYRSEIARTRFGNIYQFKITRISLKKLNANNPSRSIAICFHRDSLRHGSPGIGYIETTEQDLRDMPLYAILPIRRDDGSYHGYARVEQKETNESRFFLSLVCFIGGPEQQCWTRPEQIPGDPTSSPIDSAAVSITSLENEDAT